MDIRPIDASALTKKDTLLTIGFRVPDGYLNALRDEIYQDAVEHGLWEVYDAEVKRVLSGDPDFTDIFGGEKAIIHAWASNYVFREVEELENAAGSDIHFAEELADVIIMSMSVAGKLGIDIDAAIRRKMEINKQRPWKHQVEKK